jgi:succinyl-CoA synthetase alpha subunit
MVVYSSVNYDNEDKLKIDSMSVLVGNDTRLVVQGLTGSEGSFHAGQMVDYGTNVVAGVTPGKGGQTHEDIPIYNTVAGAVKRENANTSIIFVPPPFAGDAITEAAFAGIEVIICITEGIPVKDMIAAKQVVNNHGATLIGPNCPGVITPGEAKIGIMPGNIFTSGKVGLISRSGTLTYEAVDQLTKAGLGQSTAIGIGGDPVIGTTHTDAVKLFDADEATEAIVLIGEIGGTAEEEAAAYIRENVDKPVVAFIAGSTAPPGRRMGHAGAIISGGEGSADDKKKALSDSGVTVAESPAEIGVTLKELLS